MLACALLGGAAGDEHGLAGRELGLRARVVVVHHDRIGCGVREPERIRPSGALSTSLALFSLTAQAMREAGICADAVRDDLGVTGRGRNVIAGALEPGE